MEGHTRVVFSSGKIDVGIAFVVAKQDVVAWFLALDQLRFEQQRLGFGARQGDVDARDLRHHRGDARFHVRLEKIAADALLEIAGLADIQRFAACIGHAIHAR